MSDDAVDVVVVGAGPTGLALALQAHDHGARVRVVERRPEELRPSRAMIVHPRTLEALRPLGVSDELLARGDVAPTVHLHLGQHEIPVQLGGFDLRDTAFPHLLFVPQTVVEQVLFHALAHRGLEVERGVELVDRTTVDEDRSGVMVRRGGSVERIGCTYVAGCDGANSTVRRLAGVSSQGGQYRQEVVLADVELDDGPTPGSAHAVAGRRGLLFLFSIGEHATWRMLATRERGGDDVPVAQPGTAVPAEELQALLDGAGLSARISEVGWSTRVRLEHRIASHYRRGSVFVVGDAAHVHSPAGGQGMNTGIQDALNLGWKLAFAAATGMPPSGCHPLLDSYEKERRPVAQHVRALTHALFWAEAGTGPVASFARGALAPLAGGAVPTLLRQRFLVAQGVRSLSQLRVHYRGSPLSVTGACRRRGALRPGERLPDSLVTTKGQQRHLHDLLAVPGIHVLLDRDAPALAEPVGRLVRVHRIASWPGHGIVVARPDGYIGFAAARVVMREVTDWLGLVCAEAS